MLKLAFTLPGAGPAHLEVFDVRGRRCISRDVGALGLGIHTLSIDGSGAWRPGIYYVRLQRGGKSRSVRVVLMR